MSWAIEPAAAPGSGNGAVTSFVLVTRHAIQISRLDRTEELTVRLRISKPKARLELHGGNRFAASGSGGIEFIATER